MRLIDADALIQDLSKWLKQVDPTHPQEVNAIPPMEDIIVSTLMTIDEQPTIEERKTGKWIRTRTLMHDGELYCDQCGQEHPEQKLIWNYCPNCGSYNGGET